MHIKKKKILILCGAAAVIVIATAILVLTFDINSYRPRIEATAFDATGLDVRIKGKMRLSFFPFGISARDIHVSNRGDEILLLDNLKLGAELLPLLKKQLRITGCELVKPAITIVKNAGGNYNFENPEKEAAKGHSDAAFGLNDLRISKGTLVYLDKKTGEKIEFRDFNLSIINLVTAGSAIKDSSFTGILECKEMRKKDLRIDNVKSSIKAGKGVISLTSLTMDIFGAKAEGDAAADASKVESLYKINVKVSKLDFEKLQESFGSKKVISGKGDLNASLTMKKKGSRRLINSMDGTFSLQGDNLTIHTMDLDKVLSSYETSQTFNLVDVGAFFIAGPLSTVAIKGYRYGNVYNQTRGGQDTITHFSSHWKIRAGVAEAEDCALSTRNNRVALKGRLDLVRERYDHVIVALLDDKGCAKFRQGISGPFGNPQIGAINAVESLAGPIFHLYRKSKRFLQGGRCEVFYKGSVPQPSQ